MVVMVVVAAGGAGVVEEDERPVASEVHRLQMQMPM